MKRHCWPLSACAAFDAKGGEIVYIPDFVWRIICILTQGASEKGYCKELDFEFPPVWSE
jgi:hypothetical protein